jgi:C1A family cysteine protease
MNIEILLGCKKSPYDERDYLVTPLVADILETLPSKFDVSDKMTPVKNQGREGACVGFAGVAVKEYQEKIDYGLEGDQYIDLSERFLYEKSKEISGHREGTTLVACAKVLVHQGVCEDKFWEYEARMIGEPLEGAQDNALKYKIDPAYVRITNEKELKASIVKYGAVIIGVKVYRNWYDQKEGHIPNLNWWQSFLSSIGFYQPLGGHAICLVGYDDDTQEYKFKNSWSEKWGDKGYGYITYKHMKQILMDAICMVDIDDPKEWEATPIKTVGDLTKEEKKYAWV